MTTPQNEESLTIYLMIDDEEPVLVPEVVGFGFTGETPEAYEKWENARWGSPLRARRMRRPARWRRAAPGDLNLRLDYDPRNRAHHGLVAAGEQYVRLTLRIAICDATGQALSTQDVDCSILRYTISLVAATKVRFFEDGRTHALDVQLCLKRHGDFRDVAVPQSR